MVCKSYNMWTDPESLLFNIPKFTMHYGKIWKVFLLLQYLGNEFKSIHQFTQETTAISNNICLKHAIRYPVSCWVFYNFGHCIMW